MRGYVCVTNPFDGQVFISKLQKLYSNKFQTFSFVEQKCIYTATVRAVHQKFRGIYVSLEQPPLKLIHLPKFHCHFYSYWFKLIIFYLLESSPSLLLSLSISISSVSPGIWIKTLRVIECSRVCLLCSVMNQWIY